MCTPGYIWGKWSEADYKNRATGEGVNFRERNQARVSCTVCRVKVAASSLKGHMLRQHGRSTHQTREVKIGRGGPMTYVVSFPQVLKTVICPVPVFPSVAHSVGRMREHFMYRHFFSGIAVAQ